MPQPVSLTVNTSRLAGPPERTVTRKPTLPCSVYFTALLNRLVSNWRRRCGSRRTVAGTSGCTSQSNARPLRSAHARVSCATWVTRPSNENDCSRNCIAPWSRRAASSTSLSSCVKVRAASCATSQLGAMLAIRTHGAGGGILSQ